MASEVPGRLIVGVDGALPSVRALRWALRHAAETGNAVDVVIAWQGDTGPAAGGSSERPPEAGGAGLLTSRALDEELAVDARRTAERCVRLASSGRPDVRVRVWAFRGDAGEVLCELAGPADLLVVGPAGHRAVIGATLGSVTSYLMSKASCPVVVVPSDDEERSAGFS